MSVIRPEVVAPAVVSLRPAAVAAVAAEIALLAALLTPPVRMWFYASGLIWLYLGTLACLLSVGGVPLVRAFALRRGVLDHPSDRKVHATATPLLGGAAVYAAFAVTVLHNFNFSPELKGVAVGATLIVAVGLADVVFDLPAWLKLVGQVAGAGVAISYGVILDTVPTSVPGFIWFNVALTMLWLLTVTNAVQFLDGMDGLAGGLGVVAALFFSITAMQTGQKYLMYLSVALLGACLGFLPYNFRPGRAATIFLGDGGSSFIGFTLAGLAAMGEWSSDPVVALLTPLLILGVPLFDIGFVSVARIVMGKVHSVSAWLAYTGKDHLHHRFTDMGMNRTQSVLLILFISFTLGLSALLLARAAPYQAALLVVQATFILAIVAVLETVGRGRSPR
jgi:UDP-GlcNAc:undecaprenyl-phosphate GlcNAc-1-phosphate transferase